MLLLEVLTVALAAVEGMVLLVLREVLVALVS
jgi:hypothetical protein